MILFDYSNLEPLCKECLKMNLAQHKAKGTAAKVDLIENVRMQAYEDVQTPQDLSACASIKYQNLNLLDADTLIVDFGPSDCLCADNRYRRGKILAILTSAYYDSTNTSGVIIAFNGYYVNDNKVEGTKTVIVKGRNVTTSNYEFTSTVAGKITNRLAQTMTWNATETKVVLNQTSYSSWYGATYSITGTASGSGFNGTNYSSSPPIWSNNS